MTGNPFPYDFVEIAWVDALTESYWKSVGNTGDAGEPVTSRGWLIKKGKMVVLAASIYYDEDDEEHTTSNRLHIPKGMVKVITVLDKKASKPKSETAVATPASDSTTQDKQK